MNERRMRDQILVALEYSSERDSWVTPVAEALDRLTAEQALERPHGAVRCIWEIVLHASVWNENIIERIRTRLPERPTEGSWPPLPPSCNEDEWRRAKNRLASSLNELKRLIGASTLDELDSGPYGIGDLLCRFSHIAYHLGQITKMREAIGS